MVNSAFLIIFAVFDPSPLTLCINCSFFTYIVYNRDVPTNARMRLDEFHNMLVSVELSECRRRAAVRMTLVTR